MHIDDGDDRTFPALDLPKASSYQYGEGQGYKLALQNVWQIKTIKHTLIKHKDPLPTDLLSVRVIERNPRAMVAGFCCFHMGQTWKTKSQ